MNHIDLQGRVAVVTGGAQGIGLATCERLLRSGASVVIWDIEASRMAEAQARLAGLGTVTTHVVELTDDAAVAAVTAATVAQSGRIDILVNNAGITGGNATTWDLDPQMWRRVIEVNLIAPYLTCRHVAPVMMRQAYGRIVNIASVAGKDGNPNASAYSASKAAVMALTKSLGKELADTGVRVNCVTPAAVKTAIFDQMKPEFIQFMLSKIPMGRFGTPEEVAAMVSWLCTDDCSFSTGAVFDLSGGRSTY
jgi:3-oxoacyl-[acyl-carrier protein] reductase